MNLLFVDSIKQYHIAITCVGQNNNTAVKAAKHTFGRKWMSIAHKPPSFGTPTQREGGELINNRGRRGYQKSLLI